MHRNAAMLPFYQFLYNGESHPGAFYFVASLQRLEQLKDLIVELGQYTRAVLADDEFHEVSHKLSGKDNFAAPFIVVLNGVVNEVSQNLFQLRTRRKNHREFALNANLNVRRWIQDLDDAGEDVRQVGFTGCRIGAANS